PWLDRIDLQISLQAVDEQWMDLPRGESSASVRQRVVMCRERQLARQDCVNSSLDADGIERYCTLNEGARSLLKSAVRQWAWSARVIHRTLRVARTLADMQASDCIAEEHVAEAAQYRRPWSDGGPD